MSIPRWLRAKVWRWRWLLVAGCLAVAVAAVVTQLAPPTPPAHPVLVAARDVPPGVPLTEADLRTEEWSVPPPQTLSVADAVGATTTIALSDGVPVTAPMVLGQGLADRAPAGTVVAPAPLADATMVSLLRVGDRVDLYLASGDTGGQVSDAVLVAEDALVLALPPAPQAPDLLGTAPAPSTSVVLAVRTTDAAALSGASGFGPFRAVLITPG